MFLDFGLLSLLLVVGHLLRANIRWLQVLYVPTPMIAGFLGLLLGPQLLNWLPLARDAENQPLLSTYPSFLVAILFATLFMGARKRQPDLHSVVRRVGDTFLYNIATEFGQYGLALLIGVFLLTPLFPGLPGGFALMLPGGFAGGHGTATAISTVLEAHGWAEAKSVGFTFATVGLLSAVLGGMLLINIGTRLGWTRFVASAQDLPEGVRRGLLSEAERVPLGQETVSHIALDPLGWHVALVLGSFALAFLGREGLKRALPGAYEIPLYALTVLAGGGVQWLLDSANLGQYVDRQTISRIGSTVSDYLIACGIASIKLSVVVDHAAPLAIMCCFGVAYSMAVLWIVGRKVYQDFWFERSLFVYGWNTGVVASAITLLRVIDPRLKSKTLEDYGLAYVAIAPIDIALLVILPSLVARGIIVLPAVVLVLAALVCVAVSALTVGWFPYAASVVRPGEQAVIEEP